jgi:hypothetical protein
MSLKLAGRLFTGPFPLDSTEVRANQSPVIFAVIAKGGKPWAPVFRVVDIDASPDAGVRLADHPRHATWTIDAGESIGVYLFYAPRSEFSATERKRIADELRCQYNPPRGLLA